MTRLGRFWYAMPWNGLFWLTVFALFGAAGAFAYTAETRRTDRLGIVTEQIPDLNTGDAVQVVMILNGDELVIEREGRRARLRMLGIHSFDPVVNEREITAFGDASVRFLEQWVQGKTVTLHFDEPKRDVHGRYLAYIELGDIDINERMVSEGLAMVYTEFSTAREAHYLVTEQPARQSRRGVWGGKKARKRIVGLRRAWAEGRAARDDAPVDPLLLEKLR